MDPVKNVPRALKKGLTLLRPSPGYSAIPGLTFNSVRLAVSYVPVMPGTLCK